MIWIQWEIVIVEILVQKKYILKIEWQLTDKYTKNLERKY